MKNMLGYESIEKSEILITHQVHFRFWMPLTALSFNCKDCGRDYFAEERVPKDGFMAMNPTPTPIPRRNTPIPMALVCKSS
jgi:hypothetical protein